MKAGERHGQSIVDVTEVPGNEVVRRLDRCEYVLYDPLE
jgi:hypothetical protein